MSGVMLPVAAFLLLAGLVLIPAVAATRANRVRRWRRFSGGPRSGRYF